VAENVGQTLKWSLTIKTTYPVDQHKLVLILRWS